MEASWTISELSERVADALARSADVPGGKARAIPDERAIRYYTTLGLLDRATLRGRTAYYGGRHLAQLIAIKKMQADGASLAEIQELLPAIDDVALAELTGVALAARPRPIARRDFWRAAEQAAATVTVRIPDNTADAGSGTDPDIGTDAGTHPGTHPGTVSETHPRTDPGTGTASEPSEARSPEPAAAFTAEHHLELAPGVYLSISASRVPTDADADALRVAAAAVLAELARRRLVVIPASHQRTKP